VSFSIDQYSTKDAVTRQTNIGQHVFVVCLQLKATANNS